MNLVTIETPYGANNAEGYERNMRYTVLAAKHSQHVGECPYAPNFIAQQVTNGIRGLVNEEHPDLLGVGKEKAFMVCNTARDKADKVVFYTDLGMSGGMCVAEKYAKEIGKVVEYRKLPEEFMKHLDS